MTKISPTPSICIICGNKLEYERRSKLCCSKLCEKIRKSKYDHKDYMQCERHKNLTYNINKSCTMYLGIHIAERILSKIFEKVNRPESLTNPNYDFTCSKGYKIDVKSSTLLHNKVCNIYYWQFNINKNKIADYFLLLAFNNRNDLEPQHLWLIKGNEIIGIKNKRKLNEKSIFSIGKNKNALNYYNQFEQKDKLEKVIDCCNNLKSQ